MRVLNRIRAVGVASLACLALVAGCGGSDSDGGSAEDGDEVAGLINSGEIVVGTSGSYPPFTYVDDSGELTGYDVDVSKEIAERLDLEADIQAVDFSALLAGLSAGKYDAVASAISIEADESPDYGLSDATLVDGITLLVRADGDIQALEDIDGHKLGGPAGTAAFDSIKEAVDGDWEVITFPGMTEAVQGLKDGRVDALAVTKTVGSYTAKDDSSLAVLDDLVGEFHSGLAVANKDGDDLVNAINDTIAEMLDDGTIEELQQKYFGTTSLP